MDSVSVKPLADAVGAFAGLPHLVLPADSKLSKSLLGEHTLAIETAGSFGAAASAPSEGAALDPAKLLDIVLYVELAMT